MNLRPWLAGAGLTLLYLLPPISLVLSPAHRDFYHQLLPTTTLVRGITLDLFALSLLGGFFFFLLTKMNPTYRDLLVIPLLVATGWILARDAAFWIEDTGARDRLLLKVHYLPLALLLLGLLLLFLARPVLRHGERILNFALAAIGLTVVFFVAPRMLFARLPQHTQEAASFSHPPANPQAPHSLRIVWVLFDELSYDQTFDHRAANLHMPHFDQLSSESILFSNLRPVGYRTDIVIPSLLLGVHFDQIKSGSAGQLFWKSSDQSAWNAFDPQASIFADAQHLGWTTSVSGWFNPYCRILAPVLNHCYWTFSEPVAGELFEGLSSRKSSLQNALYALPYSSHLAHIITRNIPDDQHQDDYRKVLTDSEQAIGDPALSFVFIHLPIPHPPVIYRRPEMRNQPHQGSYLDNLALADIALGELRDKIQNSSDAAHTLLIVSSDHSWRVPMWRGSQNWSAEDELVSHQGVFDDRPVLMIHYPDELQATVIRAPVSAMVVHTLLAQVLHGGLTTVASALQAIRTQSAQ